MHMKIYWGSNHQMIVFKALKGVGFITLTKGNFNRVTVTFP